MFFWHTIWGIPGALLASIATGKKNPARNPNTKDWGLSIGWTSRYKKGRNRKNRNPPSRIRHRLGAMAGKRAKKRAADLAVAAAEDKITAERAAAAEEDKKREAQRAAAAAAEEA